MHDATTRPGDDHVRHGRAALRRRLEEVEAMNIDLVDRVERLEAALRLTGGALLAAGGVSL